MGKSLFEFANEKAGSNNEKQKVETAKLDEKSVKEKINNFSKLSKNDLMRELFSEVGKQKANGSFDVDNLKSQLETIKPMLDAQQISNLERLINQIK